MVGKFCNFKEVARKPGHEVSGPHAVEEVEVQGLDMFEQVCPDIRLHPDAEGMAQIGHDVVAEGPERIEDKDNAHDHEKCLEGLVRKKLIHGIAGHRGESKLDGRCDYSADHVDYKELHMGFEIG